MGRVRIGGGSKVDYMVYIIDDLKFDYVLDCDG